MNRYQILYKFFLLLIILLIFKSVYASDAQLTNKNQNNIYIIGSSLGYEFNNVDKYKIISILQKKYNLINLSNHNFSIYDQLNAFEEIEIFNNDKIIILLENFYLESIFFELNYINTICNKDKKTCKKIDFIPYEKMYLPLIEILHKRLEDLFLFHNNKVVFLVSNLNIYQENYNSESHLSKIKDYFNNKYGYCYISNIKINDNFDCIKKYVPIN